MPLSQTLLLWQSLLTAAVIVVMSMAIAFYSAPAASRAPIPRFAIGSPGAIRRSS